MSLTDIISDFITNMNKYLQSDWLIDCTILVVFVLCFQYLYSLTKSKKPQNTTFDFRSGKIEMYSLKTN